MPRATRPTLRTLLTLLMTSGLIGAPVAFATFTGISSPPSSALSPAEQQHLEAKAALRTLSSHLNDGMAATRDFAVRHGYQSAAPGSLTRSVVDRFLTALDGHGRSHLAHRLSVRVLSPLAINGARLHDHGHIVTSPVVQIGTHEIVFSIFARTHGAPKLYRPRAPESDLSRYDLPTTAYAVEVAVAGKKLRTRAVDPLTGWTAPVQILRRARRQAVLLAPVTDYPRLMRVIIARNRALPKKPSPTPRTPTLPTPPPTNNTPTHRQPSPPPTGAQGQPSPITSPSPPSTSPSPPSTSPSPPSTSPSPPSTSPSPPSTPPSPPSVNTGWTVPFAANGPWRTPFPASPPLDPQSPAIVANLLQQIHDNYGHAALNTSSYSAPIFTVPADQPTVTVTYLGCQNNSPDPGFIAQGKNVPIPANAFPSLGTDGDIVIWQPSTDTEWEFWKAVKDPSTGNWTACYGGRIDHVSSNPGIFPYPYGTSASGLPMLAYLIRPSELQAGHIDHAISLEVPNARGSAISWPANRTDGLDANPTDPAQGERFRLDPALDLSTLHLSPGELVLAKAMQQYGLIVTDTSGAVAIEAEDPRPYMTNGQPDPYESYFPGGQSSWLKDIPWSRLQALVWNYGKPTS